MLCNAFLGRESTSVSSDIIFLHGKLDVLNLFNEFMLRQEKTSVRFANKFSFIPKCWCFMI